MPVSEAHKRGNAKWDKEHMTTIGVKVTRALAESFTAACKKLGVTKGQVLRQAVLNSIKAASEKTEGE